MSRRETQFTNYRVSFFAARRLRLAVVFQPTGSAIFPHVAQATPEFKRRSRDAKTIPNCPVG